MDMGAAEEGEDEIYGESNMEIYNTIYKIDSQQEFAVWLRELKQGLCDNLEGWDGEGDGEMYGDSNMEIYNTIYKTEGQQEFAVWIRELKQGLCDHLEEWDGEGYGREVQEGGDMGIPMADSCWCVTENHKILWSNYPSIKK